MAKATKQLGGAAKDKYFRELFASAPGLAPQLARRLAELTKTEVSQVRIRQPLLDRARLLGAAVAPSQPAPEAETTRAPAPPPAASTQPAPAAEPVAAARDTASPLAAPSAVRTTTVEPAPQAASAAGEPFDPFAFTAVVVLKRQGAEALKQRLAGIAEPAHLRLLAEKQHLGVPAEATDATALRSAILAAAQARIDDRRAAAS